MLYIVGYKVCTKQNPPPCGFLLQLIRNSPQHIDYSEENNQSSAYSSILHALMNLVTDFLANETEPEPDES